MEYSGFPSNPVNYCETFNCFTILVNYDKMAFMNIKNVVGIAGDWHGDLPWALNSVRMFSDAGVKDILHLGDFGIFSDPEGEAYLETVSNELRQLNMRILVTPGNHEDYTRINATPVTTDGLQWMTDVIAVMPRGFRWEISGRRFVSLGGAASINFPDLKEGISWWREEAITAGDIYRLADGGPAQIMLAHDAPNGISALENSHRNGKKWSVEGLEYSDQSRRMMDAAVDIVRPMMFFHGHYHLDYRETIVRGGGALMFDVNCVGMNMNGRERNLGILDTVMLKFNYL